MEDKLLNPEGLPWTVGVGLFITILLILLTGGTFIVLLGCYLAYWLHRSHGRPRALFYYGILIGIGSLYFLPNRILPNAAWTIVDLIFGVLWIATAFVLRHEIINAYRDHESYELTIHLLWTLLFGSIYLNYCIPPYTPREVSAA